MTGKGPMIKNALIRTIGLAATCAVLAACASNPPPIQALARGSTSEEVTEYAIAQTQYRFGAATGNGDEVAKAQETFRQIPREIFSRHDPKLFEAELACEQYPEATPAADSMPTPSEPQCRNIEQHYNAVTNASWRDLEARIAAADLAIIAQAGTTTRP
jgi:hypothetical protein